ncbi:hypothetical protein [Nocardiopsis sp. SBT366]|uniref:hypothetical protein n=1 Tax=Nocardiopsis sp. SBT366 TaxID=1580529 RepID=UPI000A515114|nr:hypothetical protein [Nocardiopsis sp. SBT366]
MSSEVATFSGVFAALSVLAAVVSLCLSIRAHALAVRAEKRATAVARTCHVDLQLTPGYEGDCSSNARGTRWGRITNHGDEVAHKVTIDRRATDLAVGNFEIKDLNKGDWLEFEFNPPSVKLPERKGSRDSADDSQDYVDPGISHTFVLTFQRNEDLGGGTRERTFRYEDVFGDQGKPHGGDGT